MTWLGGVRAVAGNLQRELLRDGKLHQLEAFALGHVPTTLVFTDRDAHFHVAPFRALIRPAVLDFVRSGSPQRSTRRAP